MAAAAFNKHFITSEWVHSVLLLKCHQHLSKDTLLYGALVPVHFLLMWLFIETHPEEDIEELMLCVFRWYGLFIVLI